MTAQTPKACDICGAAALESQGFVVEQLPFRPARRYCPACHRRFQFRVLRLAASLPILFALLEIGKVVRGTPPLELPTVWAACLLTLQWVLVLPHELGHALAARWAGYTKIRILVGFGRTLAAAELLGFPWIFNILPMGGLTLAQPLKFRRWKHFVVVAAGPAVNGVLAFAAWVTVPAGTWFDHHGTLPKLFFWANLLVLAENLFPYSIATVAGMMPSDGMQLWSLLVYRAQVGSDETRLHWSEVAFRHVLKWFVFGVMSLGALFFIAILAWVAFHAPDVSVGAGIVLAVSMAGLSALCVWAAIRVAREPIPRTRKRRASAAALAQLTPRQRELLHAAATGVLSGQIAAAEKACDELLGSPLDAVPAVYAQALSLRLSCRLYRDEEEIVEAACREYAASQAATEHKLALLDGVASQVLYGLPKHLELAERLARLGLEMAPGSLTLKGTLGGLLAEQGKMGEAEPLLRECLARSPALHDQGICTFYLGVIALAAGRERKGRRLIKRGCLLHPEEWMRAKAEKMRR